MVFYIKFPCYSFLSSCSQVPLESLWLKNNYETWNSTQNISIIGYKWISVSRPTTCKISRKWTWYSKSSIFEKCPSHNRSTFNKVLKIVILECKSVSQSHGSFIVWLSIQNYKRQDLILLSPLTYLNFKSAIQPAFSALKLISLTCGRPYNKVAMVRVVWDEYKPHALSKKPHILNWFHL